MSASGGPVGALPPLPDWVHRLPEPAHDAAGLDHLRACLQAVSIAPLDGLQPKVIGNDLSGHELLQADRAQREYRRACLAAWKRKRKREKKLRRRDLPMPAASDETPAQGPWNPP